MFKNIKLFILASLLFCCLATIAQPTFPTSDFIITAGSTSVISANSLCGAGKNANILNGWYITVSTASNCGFNINATSPSNGHINFFTGLGGGLTNLTFGSDDGSEFALKQIHISVSTAAGVSIPMFYQGYKNGSPVSGATLIANNPSAAFPTTVAVTFSTITGFQDVDDIMVTPQSAMVGANFQIWDITIGTATPVVSCPTPTPSLTGQTNVLCNGGSTGSATVTASGGSPFTYNWLPSGGTSSVATGLSANTYSCIVTNSCALTATQVVNITQPTSLASSTAITNPVCNGGGGSATVTASGGTAPYTYTWSSGPTSSVEPTLLAGNYTIKVIDNNGCNLTKTVTITQPSAIATSTAVTDALCNGANGSATVTATGGTGAYSYTWSSGPTTSVEPTLLAGTYTVRVTDANSCIKVSTVTINQPSALVTTTAMTPPLCNGQNGSGTVTASGGTGAYSYTWSSGPTTSVEPTLLAGTYTVRVTDANNCSTTKSVTITQPSAVSTSTGFTNVFCNGGVGSASVFAVGGTSPYTYTWSTGATGTFIINQPAGSYTVKAIDANNCSSSTRTVVISQPAALVTTTAVTSPSCNGGLGSATVTASGGYTAGAYSYTWQGGGTTSVVTKSAGTYTVRVTDLNNCTNTNTVTITAPGSGIITSTAVTNVNCFGGSDGSATVTASGGTSPYTYSWTPSATSSVVTGLTAGVITVTVSDTNSCTTTNTVTITQPAAAFAASTLVTNILCFGNSTGAATVNASGGTSPYTYLWSSAQTTSVISGLTAAARTVTITDANSCTLVATANITEPASALTSATAVTNVFCFGNSTGAATVTASGGTAPYTYLWSGAQTTSVISGQTSGVRTVTITDANACTTSNTVTITQPVTGMTTSTAVTNVLCFGNSTGAATITVSGGTSPFTYLWSGAQTTSVISGQTSGVRTVTVTDASACTTTNTVTITQPAAAFAASTLVTNILCFGNSTGAATVNASGGTSPYTYLWSSAQTTSVISGLTAAARTVTITDANSCTLVATANITEPASALTSATAVTNVFCFGNSTGAATVTASGGTAPYTYLWSGAQTTSVISGQTSGVRTVTITDANACTTSNTVTITQPVTGMTTSTAVTNVLCFGNSTGAATITVSGGTSPFTYLWSGAQTTSVISGQTSGVRTVTVTDASACTTTNTVTITQPAAAFAASTLVTNILCFGNSTGAATVNASGGTSPYTYLWSSAQTTSVISGLTAAARTVTITDANSCTLVATANITQPASAITSATAVTNVFCFGNSTGAATVTASGGTAPYTYLWSGAQTTSVISGQTSGVRTVTITDANACTTSNTVTITQPVTGMTTSTAVTNVLCFGNSTGAATITVSGGTSPFTYLWSGAQTTSVISGQTSGVKTVTVTDASACTTTNTVTITQPAAAFAASTLVTNILCFGNSTGAATVNASGGTSPYTYLWSSVQTTSVISGLTAAARTVTITDANSCTLVATANITEPASALTSATAVTNVFCFGNSTGAATVTASGGTAPYTYLWSGAQTTSVISGQTSGVRTVTITDANACTTSNTVTITQPVTGMTTSTAVTNVLCFGNSTGAATITVSGGTSPFTYLWSGAQTTSVISGQNSGVRTVTVTDASACTTTNTVTITQPAAALTTTITSLNPLCNGGTGAATIAASGGTGTYNIVWSSSATSSVITSLVPGVYTASVTDINSCQSTKTATISSPPALSLTANSSTASLCSGNTATLTANASGGTGVLTYTWINGLANSTQTVNPSTNTVYTLQVTDANTCTIVQTVSLTVNTTPTIVVSSFTICSGATASIIANGADTYTWNTGSNSNSLVVSPTSNTVYVVNGRSNAGCSASTQNASVTVSTAPSIVVNSSTICAGQSATLTASGVSTYSWNTGATTSSIVVSPNSNTVITVNGTLTGCPVPATNTSTVNVIPVPTIAATSGTICEGQSFVIVPSGASTYTINSGSFTVNPISNTSYSVSGTGTNGCVSTTIAITTITVHPNPTISVSSGSICEGQTYTILPSGASTYTFSNGNNTISPLVTTSYSVTGTSSVGCAATNTAIGTVTVNVNPTITVPSGSICSGQTFTLNPSGANTYTYSSTNNTVAPNTTTSYSVIGTSTAGCVSTSSGIATVSVSASPTITVNSGTLCSGQSFTLIGSGANTYTYSSGNVVSPINTNTYSVIGTSTAGCVGTNTAIATITVFALPQLSITPQTICNGATATLTASGANTYTWSNLQSGNSITVNPVVTTSYSAVGTSTDGCVGNTVVTSVTVTAAPVISVNTATICNGSAATLIASGVDTYSWNTGPITSSIVVNPTITSNYTVTGFLNGCSVMANNTTTVTVNPLPVISISGVTTICNGQTATLSAIGADTYTWSNNINGTTTSVSPSVTSNYSVVGTNTLNGCRNSANYGLNVNALPILSIAGNSVICLGNTASLTVSGAQTYTWTNGSTNILVTLSPTLSTNYSVTGTDSNGCENSIATSVSVTSLPTLVVSQGTVCAGKTYTIAPTGASSYTYSSGSAAVTPSINTVYTVSGSNAENCVNSTTMQVVVFNNPTVNAGNNLTIKVYDNFTLNATATGASSYTWSPASMVNNPNLLQATGVASQSSNFTVVASSSVGCTASATVFVEVNTDNLEISNYMSPNGDGVNDTWKVNNPYYVKDYSVEVLDQWGNSVYNKPNNYNNEWNGTDQNDRDVPDGVYFYVFLLDGVVKHSGSITLLR